MEDLVADTPAKACFKKLDVKTGTALELPGYYRAKKKWDLIVVSEGRPVKGMEFKSRSIPSLATISIAARKRRSAVRRTSGWLTVKAGSARSLPRSLAISSCSKTSTGRRLSVRNKEPYFNVDPVLEKAAQQQAL